MYFNHLFSKISHLRSRLFRSEIVSQLRSRKPPDINLRTTVVDWINRTLDRTLQLGDVVWWWWSHELRLFVATAGGGGARTAISVAYVAAAAAVSVTAALGLRRCHHVYVSGGDGALAKSIAAHNDRFNHSVADLQAEWPDVAVCALFACAACLEWVWLCAVGGEEDTCSWNIFCGYYLEF